MNAKKSMLSIILAAVILLGVTWQVQARADTVDYYKVSADSLNVRSDPDKNGSIVGSLRKGDIVAVSKEEHGWLKVALNKTAGWVAGYYLIKSDAKSTASSSSSGSSGSSSSSKQKIVNADSLRMREGPGTSYSVVGSLARGEAVTVNSSQDGWSQVSASSGQRGWVSSQYLGSSSSGTTGGSSSSGTLRGKVIVVDPGHGGDDPGMIGTKWETLEKELNLQTAQLLADKLRAKGAQVIMTRTSDTKPSLSDRVKVSENANADAFVSIHYNSSEKNTSGTLTFYYGDKDKPLARAIEGQLADSDIGLRSNGYAFGDYHVLRENAQVAALVELGFLSNEKDEALARTSSYKIRAAAAIAEGLADYFE